MFLLEPLPGRLAAGVALRYYRGFDVVHRLDGLSWMVGSWFSDEGDSLHDEVWIGGGGGLMLGLHREVRQEGELLFEYLRIEESGEGLTYYSTRRDDRPTAFSLRNTEPERVEFQRAFPDFPSLVAYWRDGEELCSRVEGLFRGRTRILEWKLQRRAPSGKAL